MAYSPPIDLRSGVIADSPTDAADQVRVSVPNLLVADRITYGPYPFRPRVNAAGQVIFPQRGDKALIGGDWLVSWSRADSGPASPGPAGAIFARKPTNETVANSNTLQDDDDLGAPVGANTVYAVKAWLHWQGPGTPGPGIRAGWSAPAGAALDWGDDGDSNELYLSLASVASRAGTLQQRWLALTGLLVVGGTAGDLRLRWAQNTASATATTVYANSWLRLQKVS